MRKSILLFVLFALLNIPLMLFAQGGYKVTGHVVSAEDNEPMIGVSILQKGTTNGVITDINGNYTLEIKGTASTTLSFSYIGMQSQQHEVNARTGTLNVRLVSDAALIDEVVVVGYGKKKKSNVAGATAKINLKAKEKYKTPQPVIGKRKYKKYLEENLIRPNDESCKDVKGEVVLSFFVDKEGRPQNITVVHGLCESADKEAIRLVKEGPKWTSGDLPTRVTVEF